MVSETRKPPQPPRPIELGNASPKFVLVLHIPRHSPKLLPDSRRFDNSPHSQFSLYQIQYLKSRRRRWDRLSRPRIGYWERRLPAIQVRSLLASPAKSRSHGRASRSGSAGRNLLGTGASPDTVTSLRRESSPPTRTNTTIDMLRTKPTLRLILVADPLDPCSTIAAGRPDSQRVTPSALAGAGSAVQPVRIRCAPTPRTHKLRVVIGKSEAKPRLRSA
jgi:hypothetical protein